MRKILPLVALTLVFGAASAPAATPPDREAELARALAGYEPGEPVNCIDLRRIHATRVITDTAIVYDAGRTLYVNRPRAGADSLNRWDVLLTRLPSNRLCSIDTVQLIDQSSHMLTGIVFLGEFVPYRRVQTSAAD